MKHCLKREQKEWCNGYRAHVMMQRVPKRQFAFLMAISNSIGTYFHYISTMMEQGQWEVSVIANNSVSIVCNGTRGASASVGHWVRESPTFFDTDAKWIAYLYWFLQLIGYYNCWMWGLWWHWLSCDVAIQRKSTGRAPWRFLFAALRALLSRLIQSCISRAKMLLGVD